MMRALYTAAVIGAQPFLRGKLRRRGRAEPGYLSHVEERFGRYEGPAQPGALWIHAVSLGETRAAAILLEQLRRERPGIRILLTHGTATGRAEGERLLREGDQQAWLPWDTPAAVTRFIDHFQPAAGVLMETEVWPNLVALCKQRGVPLALANARLSEKSLHQSLRFASLSRPAYAALAAGWAQTDDDARRLSMLGARVDGVFGNLKFDATPDASQLAQGRRWREMAGRPVLMFASSREGEEEQFLRALAAAGEQGVVQPLVVPRHPQRFGEVTALAASHGLRVSRRSAWGDGPLAGDLWVGDSLGEMALYYGLSDVALLGGSFEPLGGQNLIEAAACGCPVVMGPHTFNFAEAAELSIDAGAALRVPDMRRALAEAVQLARSPDRLAAARRAAMAFTSAHQGAAARSAHAVLSLLDTSS
jgi:3-deoxy-D-manno-octulosonic-acid transferase